MSIPTVAIIVDFCDKHLTVIANTVFCLTPTIDPYQQAIKKK